MEPIINIEEILTDDKIKVIQLQNEKKLKQNTKAFKLYDEILKYDFNDKFSHDFIDLAYQCLKAWGMGSRRAKLVDFENFEHSILKVDFSNTIKKLNKFQIKTINDEAFNDLHFLFNSLAISEMRAKLGGFSKLMHFFLPNLVAPIDRTYTLAFFYPGKTYLGDEVEDQFNVFKNIHVIYQNFALSHNLERYISDKGWNRNIPKIIDNVIIGYMRDFENAK